MATRKELYGKFGPRLFEAFADLVLTEINDLRTSAGKPNYSKEQLGNSLLSKYDNLGGDWTIDV
jgi:hypothetical protein